MLVFQKIIGGIAHAPVTVAHEDIAGAVGEGEHGRIQKGAVKTRIGAHAQCSPKCGPRQRFLKRRRRRSRRNAVGR